ncbi:MAG: AEC family transporter [Candidatus Competibacteraceae bacterium]
MAETVVAFALMVIGAYLMKRKGVFKQEDGALFAELLTQVVLPATIFYQLWKHPLSSAILAPVLIMFLSAVAALLLSWLVGRVLRFDQPSIGALMIVSSFGSSALIGYPIIEYAFPGKPDALANGIAISELGVGLPIFILCPAVAMYFGGTFKGLADLRELVKNYFLSPIFLAVILGLIMSQLDLPSDMILIATLREALHMMQGALVVIAAVILGIQLSFESPHGLWKLIVVSLLVQMLFQPWLNAVMADTLKVSLENRQLLVLIGAMPAAILGPVFAARYACAAHTTALLTFTHIVVSPVVIPAVFAWFV